MVASTPVSSLPLPKCCLGDAVMRLSSLQFARLRPFHTSSVTAATSDIFSNSLRKTLEAHRSTNRSRLIRKIFPADDPAGLWRPGIPTKPPPPQTLIDIPVSKNRKNRKNVVAPTSHGQHAIQSTKYPIQTPWLNNLKLSRSNAESALDTEIRALEQYLTPNAQENNRISTIKAEVASLLTPVVSRSPKVIGSHCTGLAIVHSGIDFLLPYEDAARSLDRDRRPSPTRPQIREAHIRLLRQVEKVLRHTDTFSTVEMQRNSALSAQHQPTGLLLHFYCGEDIPAITEYLQDYQAEYPAMRPLYVATRTLLEGRGLFGSPQAGIGPDALAMLIVAFLKLSHGRFAGPSTLGCQWLAFLQFYGTQTNIQSVGISVDPPGLFSTRTLSVTPAADEPAHLRGQRSLINAKCTAARKGNIPVAQRLCIQDPSHYMNDLGRSCTRTPELQAAFADAHRQLRDACNEWASDDNPKKSSILIAALRGNFEGCEKMHKPVL